MKKFYALSMAFLSTFFALFLFSCSNAAGGGGSQSDQPVSTTPTTPTETPQPGQDTPQPSPNTYTITYNLNGGTNPSENLASYTDGTTVTLADPERLGCDFAGWYEAEDFSGDAVTQLSGRSATLWAKWTLIEYSVTYIITNGSDDMQSASTMSGTYTVESELMAAPQKDGYSFKGWFLDSAQTQAVASFSGLTGAQTLYGHWAGTLYRVAYSGIDGATLAQNSAIAAEGFTTEDQTLALPTYEKRHYIFGGWIKEGGSQVTELSASSAEAGSTLTLCAKWTEVEYAVNFDLLFPSEVTNPNTAATITASTSPQALQDPIYTDNNFVFAGWYKDYQNGTYSNKITEVSVDDVAEPQSRLTLHAKWTRATPWTPSGATVRVTSMQTAADDIASLTAEEEFYLIVTDTNIESRQFKPVNAALKANANVKLYFDFSAAMTKFEFEKVLTTANCSFYSCENLSGITLPECSSFTEITENVFRGCKSLRTITLPKQITTIGNYVFRDCSSLETCVLQQNLSEIGYCAFENCSSLKEIDIPMSVRVWDSAFENCVNLETIYLARGVKFENQYNNIQKNIFKNCIKLKNVFFKSTLNYLGNLWGEGNWYGPAFYADFVYVYKDNSGSELEKAYYIRYSRAEESTQYYKPRWFTETNIPSSLAKNYAIKKGYTFGGWSLDGQIITTIPPGTNRKVTLDGVWIPNTDTPYKVLHYKENLNDSDYTLFETEELAGTTDTKTSVSAKEYEHFTADPITQKNISADGKTEVNVYYKLDRVSIALDLNGGTLDGKTGTIVETGKYGQPFSSDNPTKTGNLFVGWNSAGGTLPIIYNSDGVYTAQWTKTNVFNIVVNPISDITVTKAQSGSVITFTADDSDSYSWTLDDTLISSEQTCSINTTSFVNGTYALCLEAKKNGKWHSYYAQIKIGE